MPDGVVSEETGPFANQQVPAGGGFALLVSGDTATTREVLVQDLEIVGCSPVTIARTEAGKWQIYIPGAPASVNDASGFPAEVAAGSGFIVRCAVPASA